MHIIIVLCVQVHVWMLGTQPVVILATVLAILLTVSVIVTAILVVTAALTQLTSALIVRL